MGDAATRGEDTRYAHHDHYHPDTNGLATASLCCGIVGLIFSIIPFTFFFALPLDILAIVFGGVARGQFQRMPGRFLNPGNASAGIVTGVIGVLVLCIWLGIIISTGGHRVAPTFGG